MSLSEQDREQLDEALWGGRIYDDVPLVVGQIVTRHVAAALEQAAEDLVAEAMRASTSSWLSYETYRKAARIVRAQRPTY